VRRCLALPGRPVQGGSDRQACAELDHAVARQVVVVARIRGEA